MADFTGSTNYPSSLDSFDTTKDTTDPIGQDVTDARAALNAIQVELGTNPSDAHASVATAIEYLGALAAAEQGPQGLPGSVGLGINVRDLDDDPDSVTDWGPIINLAVAGGARHFLFPEGEYPFSTPIDLEDSRGITFEGGNGLIIAAGAAVAAGEMVDTRLVWTGAGSGAAIDTTASSGFHMKNLGVYYDNPSFTGVLIEHGAGFSSWSVIENCDLRSYEGALTNAHAIINWDYSVCQTIRKCVIGGAEWGIYGQNTEIGQVANANRIVDNFFVSCTSAFLGNIADNWVIDSNTFELGLTGLPLTPSVIDSDHVYEGLAARFTFTNNWVGDVEEGHTASLFRQRENATWRCLFSGNTIYQGNLDAPVWDLQGKKSYISINDNPIIQTPADGVVVDCGDVAGDGVGRKHITFQRNGTSITGTNEAVINRDGHWVLDIENNVGSLDVRTLSGHERVGHADHPSALPTIAEETNLGSGGNAEIFGRDLAGVIRLYPGSGNSSGLQATVTMAHAYTPAYGADPAWQFPLVFLQPLKTAAGNLGTNAVACGAYVEIVEGADFDTWKIHVSTALAASVAFGYRMIGL